MDILNLYLFFYHLKKSVASENVYRDLCPCS